MGQTQWCVDSRWFMHLKDPMGSFEKSRRISPVPGFRPILAAESLGLMVPNPSNREPWANDDLSRVILGIPRYDIPGQSAYYPHYNGVTIENRTYGTYNFRDLIWDLTLLLCLHGANSPNLQLNPKYKALLGADSMSCNLSITDFPVHDGTESAACYFHVLPDFSPWNRPIIAPQLWHKIQQILSRVRKNFINLTPQTQH
jgi:hypothetical protein